MEFKSSGATACGDHFHAWALCERDPSKPEEANHPLFRAFFHDVELSEAGARDAAEDLIVSMMETCKTTRAKNAERLQRSGWKILDVNDVSMLPRFMAEQYEVERAIRDAIKRSGPEGIGIESKPNALGGVTTLVPVRSRAEAERVLRSILGDAEFDRARDGLLATLDEAGFDRALGDLGDLSDTGKRGRRQVQRPRQAERLPKINARGPRGPAS